MRGAGDNHQFLVLAFQQFEGILAHIAAVGLLAVDDEDSAADFARIVQQAGVHHRHHTARGPTVGGVAATLVVAARGLIVVVVVLDELRGIVWA